MIFGVVASSRSSSYVCRLIGYAICLLGELRRDGIGLWMKSKNLKQVVPPDCSVGLWSGSFEDARAEHWVSLSDDGILVIDKNGTILEFNEEMTKLVGLSKAKLQGISIEEIHPCSQFPRVLALIETVLSSGSGELWETRIVRSDKGIVFVQIKGCLSVVNNEEAIYLVFRDVSERRQLQLEQKRLQNQLQAAQKLESLGVLAGTIAHDFNNHLLGILGNAGLALLALEDEHPARQCVAEIESVALKATELTKQMLAYSGAEKGDLAAVDLRDVIESVGYLLEASTSKKISISYKIDLDLPKVQADSVQLQQVLINLITNASEAIGGEVGEIAILSGTLHASDGDLRSTCFNDELPAGKYIYFEVSDTGSGMTDEAMSRVFDPLFSSKAKGRGLGMAAVLGIVRSYRGAIDLRSEVGKGTTVRILLPTNGLMGEEAEISEEDLEHWETGGTVLVVDDEAVVRAVATRTLERFGFVIRTAQDGQDAVNQFTKYKDEIVAVLLDMSMPRLGGEEVIAVIQKLKPSTPVILSSGYPKTKAMEKFAGLDPAAFIQKPYLASDLAKQLYLTLGFCEGS